MARWISKSVAPPRYCGTIKGVFLWQHFETLLPLPDLNSKLAILLMTFHWCSSSGEEILAILLARKKFSASSHPSTQGSVRCKHIASTKCLIGLGDTVVLVVSVDLPLLQKVSGALLKEARQCYHALRLLRPFLRKAYDTLDPMNGTCLPRAVLVLDAKTTR